MTGVGRRWSRGSLSRRKTSCDIMDTIIIVGECKGTYENATLKKEFEGKVLLTARPDGAVIVHNLSAGVRPICYVEGGAEVSMSRDKTAGTVEIFVSRDTRGEGEIETLKVTFTEIIALQGDISEKPKSLAVSILKCVFDMGGNYGRTTIARILTGSVSKKVLTINISKLNQYGVAKGNSMKEILCLIDWLIDENYIAYAEDSEFPVIVITSKGLDILAGDDELPVEETKEEKSDAGNQDSKD